MTTYSTSLKTWGSTGSEYPDSYSYAEGEQPVDAWDNFFNSNVVSDIESIITALNDNVIQVDGSNAMGADFDLNGNALVDDSRGFVEIGSSDDLRIHGEQVIQDENSKARLKIRTNGVTDVTPASGSPYVNINDGGALNLVADAGEQVRIYDSEQAAVAVQYDTDATAGALRTPGAGFRVEADGGSSSGSGLELRYDPGSPYSLIRSYDAGTSTHEPLYLDGDNVIIRGRGGLVDMSEIAADLRLASGNGIQSGDGTGVLDVNNSGQILAAQDGSASGPAFSFTGDTDTGIFRSGNNLIGFSAGGTEQMNLGTSALNLQGNILSGVGGTTDASAGDIRGAAGLAIYARDTTTPQDFGLDFNENSGSPQVALSNARFLLPNLSTDPSTAGEFTLNGTDVKVHTGGGVKSLSDIGSGGGSYSDEDAQDAVGTIMTGSGATSVDYDDGADTITVSSTDNNTTYTAGNDLNLSGTEFNFSRSIGGNLSLNGNNVSGVGDLVFNDADSDGDTWTIRESSSDGQLTFVPGSEDIIDFGGTARLGVHLGSNPSDPGAGEWQLWGSATAGQGDDGDVIIESQDLGGSGSKSATLFDYSGGSVSSLRYKKGVRALEADPYALLDVEAVTYTSRDSNEVTAHGFIAEELHEWNENAVKTTELTESWAHEAYLDEYDYEVGDEVPNQPRVWPILAAHHEIIRDLVVKVEERDEKIDELEGRLAAIEDHLEL